jgi:hypothetical protein
MNPSHKKDINFFEQAYKEICEKQMKKASPVKKAITTVQNVGDLEKDAKETGGEVDKDALNMKKSAEKVIKNTSKELKQAANQQ